MHEKNLCFRDLHPTRIHLVDGVLKWNLIGMPYNFKKLAKNPTFLGHLNYSAPEMILDELNSPVTLKADIWALGCCLYHLATKRDPFMCENPRLSPDQIKQNILQMRIDLPNKILSDWRGEPLHPIILMLLSACQVIPLMQRPNSS